jgi:hypothetical protein
MDDKNKAKSYKPHTSVPVFYNAVENADGATDMKLFDSTDAELGRKYVDENEK